MSPLLLVLCCLLTAFTCATTSKTYYVRPNYEFEADNTTCPSPCYTISEYAQAFPYDFLLNDISEAVMKFLPGVHFLENYVFLVFGLNKFTMIGSEGNASSVVIDVGSNISLFEVNKVEIHWLTFTGLRRSAIFVVRGNDVLLRDSVITNCSGGLVFREFLNNTAVSLQKLLIKDNAPFYVLLLFHNVAVTLSENVISNNFFPSPLGSLFSFLFCSSVLSDNLFVYNTGGSDNGYVWVLSYGGLMKLRRSNIFTSNTGRAIKADSSQFYIEGDTEFFSNKAPNGQITLENSTLHFSGNSSFVKNNAYTFGGAIVVSSDSYIHINENASILFDSNTAGNRGGAIYVFDVKSCLTKVTTGCPFVMGEIFSLEFINNSGFLAGDDIYGGNLDSFPFGTNCADILLSSSNVKIYHDNSTVSSISSDPTQVCLCNDAGIVCCPRPDDFHGPACPRVNDIGTVFPGQNMTIKILAVGQLWGATPAEIRAVHGNYKETAETEFFNYDKSVYREEVLGSTLWLSSVNATCTTITHNLHATEQSYLVSVFPDNVCYADISLVLRMNFTTSCPPGFVLSSNSCQCDERLQQFTGVFCDINNQTIQHTGSIWVGYHNKSGLIIHSSPCPFDYCINGKQVIFDLNNTDVQCDHDRSGHLCGQCSSGLSEVFGGTSECRRCSNAYLSLFIPFSLAGIALLVFLFLLRLTVDYGTLSGLIFFANIVQVNRAVFIPNGHTNVLSVFIAWLNLDLGIETCFYDGMDAYGKTWLQFVFPFYIWALCGFIIFLSSRSIRVTRLLGSNPVAVLATLFLLSYLKVFRTIIAAFSVTVLQYPDESSRVWLLDGNIEMESGKHVALFLFALLVFVVLFIPYTLLLFFDQWLQRFSHWRILSWANNTKLRAFLDTYPAPYKARHRYWTGLLLLFRIILAVVNAFGVAYDRSYSFKLFAIVGVVFFCLFWVERVYRKWPLYLLETSFFVNLGLLALSIYHVHASEKYEESDKAPYFNASISIALITFVGILIYHLFMIFRQSKLVSSVTVHVKNKLHTNDESVQLTSDDPEVTTPQRKPITSTVVELREPLLDDDSQY